MILKLFGKGLHQTSGIYLRNIERVVPDELLEMDI